MNRNCSRPGTGNSSSGFTTPTANAPAPRPPCCWPMPNCSNGSPAGATPRAWNPPPTASPCISTAIVARSPRTWKTATRNCPSPTASPCPTAACTPSREARFFNRQSPVALIDNEFFLLRNAPPERRAQVPRATALRARAPAEPPPPAAPAQNAVQPRRGLGAICVAHPAAPQFVFELLDDIVQLRLLAQSLRDKSTWVWNGHEWAPHNRVIKPGEKPEILDDARLDPAVQWLRKLDWFMQEPGLWIGDANENFLGSLAEAWSTKPQDAELPRQRRVSPPVPQPPRAQAAPGRQGQRHRLARRLRRMGGRGHEAFQGRPGPPGRRHQPLCETAQCRLGGTGHARRAGRARSHGRHGRGRPHRRAAKGGHGTRGPSGRGGIHPLCRHARGAGVARARPRFQGRAQRQSAQDAQRRFAPLSEGRLRFPRASGGGETRRHPGRRHGPGQNAPDAHLAGLAQGTAHEKSQAVAGHLPGLRAAQLAARGGEVHPGHEGAGAGKRRRPAQSAQADSAARHHRHQLRAAAARSGGVPQILLPRGHPRRGAVHQEPRRAGHAIGEAVEVRAQDGPHRHAAGKPPAGSVEHRGFHPARLSGQPGTIFGDLRAARRKRRSPSSASRAGGCPPSCVRCCCAA